MPSRTVLVTLALVTSTWSRQPARPAFPVHCLNGGCPEGVGLWVTREKNGDPSQCTAFLIGPDRILTNHHCLPRAAKSVNASCRDKARLYFPALPGRDGDSVDCQTVEALSPFEDRIDEPDWALVRLAKPLARRPLPLDFGGFADLDTVKIWVAAPDWGSVLVQKSASAQIRLQECLVSRRTSVFHDRESKASFLDPRSRRVPLVECPAWKGNSGAPVLRWSGEDSSWKVAGILDRSSPTGSIMAWAKSQELPLLDSSLGDFAYASSLGCLPLPPHSPPAACRLDSSQAAIEEDQRRWKAQVDGAIRDSIRNRLPGGTWTAKILRQGFWGPFSKAFRSLTERPEAVVVPLPRCLTAMDSTWMPPTWSVRFGFDKNMRWDMRMAAISPLPVQAKCKQGPGKSKICRFEGAFASGKQVVSTDTLGPCNEILAEKR